MVKLLKAFDGKYEVLFSYPGGWEQRQGMVVVAAGPHEAVAAAAKAGGWRGVPTTAPSSPIRENALPITARVRFEVDRDTPGMARHDIVTFCAQGATFERLPVFATDATDPTELGEITSWSQIEETRGDL